MAERFGEAMLMLFGAFFFAINPWAAAGAAFGCCFFLASPSAVVGRSRFYLGVFSFGIGYAFGVMLYGGPPPFSEKAMFVSGALSALAAVIWTGLRKTAEESTALPAWAKDILDRIPILKRGGDNDGP